MRPGAVMALLRKELTDTLRDRRTMIAMVVLPIVLYPVLFIVLGQIAAGDAARARAEQPRVAVWGSVPGPVIEAIDDALDPELGPRRAVPEDAAAMARALLRGDEVDLVVASSAAGDGLAADGTASVDLYYSEVEPVSANAFEAAAAALEELGEEILQDRVRSAGLPEAFADPISLEAHDLASAAERGGEFGGRLIPFLLLLMVTGGAMFPAIDVTAGEKERGTMQTLLVAPVKPLELIISKYLTVVIVAITSAALNLAAVSFAVGRQAASFAEVEGEAIRFSLGVGDFLTAFALLLPVAFLMAALLMSVCVFGRSFREAQNYANPVMLVAMIAGFSAFSDADLTPALAFVPLANIAMVIRDVLQQETLGGLVYLVFAANTLYAVAAILFTARVFESEQVLLGGERPWRDLRARRLGHLVPSGRSAVLFGIVLLVVAYYGSLAAVRLPFVGQVLTIQLALILVPALLWVGIGRHSVRRTLWLRWPSARGGAALVLTGLGTWALGGLVLRALTEAFPGAEGYGERLEEFIGGGLEGLGWPVAIVLVALLPAICEEVAFRGVVLSGMRSTGTAWGAVAGSAVLFGIFHASPYHAVFAAVIGAVFAYAVLATRSLLAGVFGHAVNNTVAVAGVLSPAAGTFLGRVDVVLAGLACLVAGLWLLRRERGSQGPTAPEAAPRETEAVR